MRLVLQGLAEQAECNEVYFMLQHDGPVARRK
jgi:hypothetical protein